MAHPSESMSGDDILLYQLNSASETNDLHDEITAPGGDGEEGSSGPTSSGSSETVYTLTSSTDSSDDTTTTMIISEVVFRVLEVAQVLRCVNIVMMICLILFGILCLVAAGLMLVLPPQSDGSVAHQMVNTLFTLLNISGIMCIVQGVAWGGKRLTHRRFGRAGSHHPVWADHRILSSINTFRA